MAFFFKFLLKLTTLIIFIHSWHNLFFRF